MNKVLTLLEPSDLTDTDLEDVTERCGLPVASALLDKCYGSIYIPRIVTLHNLVERYIESELESGNVNIKKMAHELHCSTTTVRMHLLKIYSKKR